DGPELDLLFKALERVHALLEPLSYGQIPGLDDVAGVGPRGGLSHQQQVVDGVVDEIEVALDIVPVDADAARSPEEALELGSPSPAWSLPPCHSCLSRPGPFEGEPD